MKALVIGEVLWDIIEAKPHLGGAPLNFAAHVRQCGEVATIISSVGRDELGDEALQRIEKIGLDTSMIQRSDFRTGFVPVTLNNGQPEYEITKDVAYDYIQSDRLDFEKISDYDTFYFGSIIQRSAASNETLYRILKENDFSNVFYDVNLRKDSYTAEIIRKSLKHCTILKVNDEEVEVIGPMIFGARLSIDDFSWQVTKDYPQIKTIVTTAGGEGCYVLHEEEIHQIPTDPIQVRDTVGAGDSFSAAFMCVYSRSGDAIHAAKVANKVGGFVASNSGPIPTYSQELKELISSGS